MDDVIERFESILKATNKDIDKYLKLQCELMELNLIASLYYLKNKDFVRVEIDNINRKQNTLLSTDYFSDRWDKFYNKQLNKKFDETIKLKVIKRDSNNCAYCQYADKIEIHHVVPQSMHGSNSEYNLVCACLKCNRAIGDNIVLPHKWWELHPESRNVITE